MSKIETAAGTADALAATREHERGEPRQQRCGSGAAAEMRNVSALTTDRLE